jgi:LysR family transcriptional regulator AphB
VRVKALLTVDAMLALAEAVKLGAGIGILPSFLADPSVTTDELIRLDLGASPAPAEATALFPRAVTPSRPVKQLVAFLVRELRDIGAGASARP